MFKVEIQDRNRERSRYQLAQPSCVLLNSASRTNRVLSTERVFFREAMQDLAAAVGSARRPLQPKIRYSHSDSMYPHQIRRAEVSGSPGATREPFDPYFKEAKM